MSSFLGCSATKSDPWKELPDDEGDSSFGSVQVPLSRCAAVTQDGVRNSSLLYNEFIVYDVKQIRIKYLCLVRFDWK